jgi:TetR/AcrR family transcriptional repressor of nem operon
MRSAVGRTSDARERLIQAAIDLIWQSSYGAVGVDAICEKAGVRKGSFYHYFESKDALVVAALDVHWEDRSVSLDAVFSPSRPPLERLRRYFDNLYERQKDIRKKYGRVLGCFHNTLGSECVQRSPEIGAKVQEIIALNKRYLITTLRDLHASGLARGRDAVADADTLYTFVIGALTQARIHDDPGLLKNLHISGFVLVGVDERTVMTATK